MEYPAYGVTGPGKEVSPTLHSDRKLAQNAQLYHYQHQKQQMMAFDNQATSGDGGNRQQALQSDNESDDGEEGDYTVYECPGLAPVIMSLNRYHTPVATTALLFCFQTGEMEVRNPMFEEDVTPKASK